MKVVSYSPTLVTKKAAKLLTTRVCMHTVTRARTDGRVMREASTLVEAGYEVSIVDIENQDVQSAEEEYQGVQLKHIFLSKSFLVTRFAKGTIIRPAWILLRGIMCLIRTPADIYHAHDVSGLIPCYIASRIHRKPLIFDSHEFPLSGVMRTRSRWVFSLLSRFLAHIVPHCAGVITVSSPIAQEISKRYRSPEISLIRNIPAYRTTLRSDRLRQNLNLPTETRIALFQGHLVESRGLGLLVLAAKFLDPGIVIVIMGQDFEGQCAHLKALIAKEKMTDRIKIIPPVPYSELLEWTASADIGLIVYQPDYSLNIRMCLPNKFFEYLMVGLPVLASQLDAIEDIINTYKVGKVVASLEPEPIGKAINSILSDRFAYESMRQNALMASQESLCWEKERIRLIELYQKVLGTK